jgi:predicted transport protein
MKGGFAESPLRMNEGLSNLPLWTEQSIKNRGAALAEKAVEVWSCPKVEQSILEVYKSRAVMTTYRTGDHDHLSSGPLREVFEVFRKQVLELDPVVREEILKLYIAYKAETNFVVVVPQAKRLRLSLNIPFPEINDPKGICRDVTGLVRWGNGDVEVGLATLDDLPYIMGLVRQAFEKQIGNGGNE